MTSEIRLAITDTLSKYRIPTTNSIEAINVLRERGGAELPAQEYRSRIEELSGVNPNGMSDEMLNFTYRYLVAGCVDSLDRELLDLRLIYDRAVEKAETLLKKNPWFLAKPDEDKPAKLDAAGNPKPKKGAKKEIAKRVYDENKHRQLKRKEWIELLVKEVGLTPAGASTYYANLKAGRY